MSGKNRRAVDKTPLNTPFNTTVLSSIRLNGDCAYTVYQEGTTAERFAEYLKTKLLPTLSEADIIVIETWNKTHNAKEIAECFSVNTSTVYRLEKQMRETATGQLKSNLSVFTPI